jgi:hypothetical protein
METTIATGTDVHGLRWSVKQWVEDGFTEYYLDLGDTRFGGKSIVLNDMLVAALEKLPELD